MKHLISLLLIVTSFAPNHASAQTPDRDQQLMAALTALQEKIAVPLDGATLGKLGFGTALLSFGAIGATATLLRLRVLPLQEWNVHPGQLMNFTVDKLKYGAAAGAALGWASAVYAGVMWAKQRGVPIDVHTAEGLVRFFRLPLEDQLEFARNDEPFGDFILKLDRDFANLYGGFDEQRAR